MKENLQHYVYALTDSRDGDIFYIGSSAGARPTVADLELAHHQSEPDKLRRIAEIRHEGGEVGLKILARDFGEPDEALAVESLLRIEARRLGAVMGLPASLVNALPAPLEDRFRPWAETDPAPRFDLRDIESPDHARRVEPLYDHVFEHVDAFEAPRKSRGAYVRSQARDNGFEFVLYPKRGRRVCFEYIAREKTAAQQRHADALRRRLGLGGTYRLAKVEAPQPQLAVTDHEAVAEALQRFVRAIDAAEKSLAD